MKHWRLVWVFCAIAVLLVSGVATISWTWLTSALVGKPWSAFHPPVVGAALQLPWA